MAPARILVFPGSLRTGSYNVRLAALMVKELTIADAEVTRISLADYPLPVYDADLEAKSGPPANAVKLKQMIMAHRGVFIAGPEYNASITPLLKNALDWVSRVRERGEPALAAYQNRVFALGSASPGRFGGMRSLLAMRQVLEVGCGALVIPDQISIAQADQAFDELENLKDGRAADQLRAVARRLIEMARLMPLENT
jgi:chromate reductase